MKKWTSWCHLNLAGLNDDHSSDVQCIASVVGVHYALRRGVKDLTVGSHDKMVVRQLRGKGKARNKMVNRICWDLMSMSSESLEKVCVRYIRKSLNMNRQALNLARQALVTRTSSQFFDVHGFASGTDRDLFTRTEENEALNIARTTSVTDDERNEPLLIDSSKTYLLRFDGGCRKNLPDGDVSGVGMVIYDLLEHDRKREIWSGWRFFDKPMSSIAAEFRACLLGLKCARLLGIDSIHVEGDNATVVNHLNSEFRVLTKKWRQMREPVQAVMSQFRTHKIRYISRDENKRADTLARYAMDTRSSGGFID